MCNPYPSQKKLSKEQRALHNDMKSVISSGGSHLQGFETETDQGALIGSWSVWLQDATSGAAVWEFFKFMTTRANLPHSVRQVTILKIGAHFKAAYELHSHAGVSRTIFSDTQIETLASNECPADLQAQDACAYEVVEALLRGGVLPQNV